ncbi:MAG: DF family (seleno)protein [Gaiellaceae bacterium]
MRKRSPLVEILYFDGCPNHEGARALVERVAAELELAPEIRLVNVPDPETAERLRFPGSPTVRVGGRDVEPAGETRSRYMLACRIYRIERGTAAQPPEAWVRDALLREAGDDRMSVGSREQVETALLSSSDSARTARRCPRRTPYRAGAHALPLDLRRFAAGNAPGADALRAEESDTGSIPIARCQPSPPMTSCTRTGAAR